MGRTVKLGTCHWKKLILECNQHYTEDGGNQSGIYLFAGTAVCVALRKESTLFQSVSDDVRASDGDCVFSGSGDFPLYLSTEKRNSEQPAWNGDRVDHTDAAGDMGGMRHDNLDEYRRKLCISSGRLSQCIRGYSGKRVAGRSRTAAADPAHPDSDGVAAAVLCIVFKYIDIIPELCADQASDRRRSGKRNEKPDLLYLRKRNY